MKKTVLLSIILVLFGIQSFAQWDLLSSGTSNYLYSVFFINADTGYACGDGGLILKTIDAGDTWISKYSGTTNPVYGITFTSADTGYAVGFGGIILKTTDGGENWSPQNSGTGNFLIYPWFSGNKGIVVGQDGTILKTTNGGATWTQITSPTPLTIRMVCFTDELTGYAVGGLYYHLGGVILKTIDGGESWTILSDGVFNLLIGVCFTDANTGYASGGDVNSATIIKTTDAGVTWDTIPGMAAIPYTLKRIAFPTHNIGYATGNYGTILKTWDAGATWTPQSSWVLDNLFGVFFNNTDTGFVVGFNGDILKTTSGGEYVGINEKQQAGELKISPNPAWEKVTIVLSEPGKSLDGTIYIYGMTGQQLICQQIKGSKAEVNVSTLQKGIYFLRLLNGDKEESAKFIKE